ncbi:MAG: hypothetical protein V3T70_00825, partial [Phycisphaerae bacterium]
MKPRFRPFVALILATAVWVPAWADEPGDEPTGSADQSLVGELASEHALLWQQAQQSFKELETQARKAVVDGDFEASR